MRVNRDWAPKCSIVASFVSNLSHLGSLPGRIPQVPTVLKGGYLLNPGTTRLNDSAFLHDIFNLFLLLRDPTIKPYILAIVSIGVLAMISLLYILIKYTRNLLALNSRRQQLVNPLRGKVRTVELLYGPPQALKTVTRLN